MAQRMFAKLLEVKMTEQIEGARTLARRFHEIYERLAPEFGYITRKETAVSWEEIPEDNANKRLMIAVCSEILAPVVAPIVMRSLPSKEELELIIQQAKRRVAELEEAQKITPELWNATITI